MDNVSFFYKKWLKRTNRVDLYNKVTHVPVKVESDQQCRMNLCNEKKNQFYKSCISVHFLRLRLTENLRIPFQK